MTKEQKKDRREFIYMVLGEIVALAILTLVMVLACIKENNYSPLLLLLLLFAFLIVAIVCQFGLYQEDWNYRKKEREKQTNPKEA